MRESEEKTALTRREFLRNISLAGSTLALTPALLNFHVERAHAVENVGKVVIATSGGLTSGMSVNDWVAERLLNEAIKAFTGKETEEEAWKSIFPSLTGDDVVGIKINTLFQLSTHSQVVDAIVQNLVRIGVPENNIVIWDKSDSDLISSGYKINRGNTGVRCFGTNADYDEEIHKIGNQDKRLSKILTQTCDHLINVPVLKDHFISGVSLSLKNHYGSINGPETMHDNNCDPYIAEINSLAQIREKTRLIVLDASLGVFSGGPMGQPQFRYNSLILGQDPVALDYQCLQIIDGQRELRGLPSVAEWVDPKHIETAAGLGLGTMDQNEIQVIHLTVKDVDPKDKRAGIWGEIKSTEY
ncbi:DUF362 domain-containing protein [Candidatus Poribacteria bacterium]